jgi:3-deoxy-D-manno-octulosonic-acid transferase
MWRYRLLLLLLGLPLVVVTVLHAIRYRDRQLLLQRLGLSLPQHDNNPVWIHAASVGEVNAVIPFIQLLRHHYPQQPLLVSTNTPTGKQVLQKHFPDIAHTYLGYDLKFIARRLVRHFNPACVLIFETEIWPNLFAQLARQQHPLIIFNGRLSEKSLRAAQRFAGAYRYALQQVSRVFARSEQDRDHYIALGADQDKVESVGNIKYASINIAKTEAINLSRPYVLAASTRDEEERYLLEALQGSLDDTLLVIAPRHPQRRAEIEKALAELGVTMAVRSRDEALSDSTQVYLADTLGELNHFIAGAEFVLMGGAFLPFGGHNILEVAQQGKAVIFGAHMNNFSNEAQAFLEHHAAIQASDQDALREAVQQLRQHPEQAQQLGDNGKALLIRNAKIAETYLERIREYCPALP